MLSEQIIYDGSLDLLYKNNAQVTICRCECKSECFMNNYHQYRTSTDLVINFNRYIVYTSEGNYQIFDKMKQYIKRPCRSTRSVRFAEYSGELYVFFIDDNGLLRTMRYHGTRLIQVYNARDSIGIKNKSTKNLLMSCIKDNEYNPYSANYGSMMYPILEDYLMLKININRNRLCDIIINCYY